eukprot:751454-Hanusia_phi.AAC.1
MTFNRSLSVPNYLPPDIYPEYTVRSNPLVTSGYPPDRDPAPRRRTVFRKFAERDLKRRT